MTQLIGILNVTPDSFSDGGKFNSSKAALTQAVQLFAGGASIVDVGAESTKPGSQAVAVEEEWGRMEDFFKCICTPPLGGEVGRGAPPPSSPCQGEKMQIQNFSLDTRNPSTARKFLELGGRIINDVSGFQDPAMIQLAAQFGATCIINHFPGTTVAEVHEQNISSTNKVHDDLLTRAEEMVKQGIARDKIVLDPGIGFGKTPELNWELLTFPSLVPDWPVLIGHSKKRFLGEQRFEKQPNVEAAQTAKNAGAAYLRVHNPEWY